MKVVWPSIVAEQPHKGTSSQEKLLYMEVHVLTDLF